MKPTTITPIGYIHSPWKTRADAPHFADEAAGGENYIEVDETFADGLHRLDSFSHITVLFHFDRMGGYSLSATPPWAGGITVGVFASRSPHRPNHIGMSTVRLLGVEGTRINISAIDALDGTPVMDIKPYTSEDAKQDASNGWLDEVKK